MVVSILFNCDKNIISQADPPDNLGRWLHLTVFVCEANEDSSFVIPIAVVDTLYDKMYVYESESERYAYIDSVTNGTWQETVLVPEGCYEYFTDPEEKVRLITAILFVISACRENPFDICTG